jgi:hypothetical protein
MEHSIEIDDSSGVCLIRASGTIRRPQDSLILLRTAGEAAKEHAVRRILFDLRESKIIGTTLGAYEAVIDPEKHGLSRHLRIAVVYSVITEDERFMENVGVNRGATAFRVFDDIDAAREWVAQ